MMSSKLGYYIGAKERKKKKRTRQVAMQHEAPLLCPGASDPIGKSNGSIKGEEKKKLLLLLFKFVMQNALYFQFKMFLARMMMMMPSPPSFCFVY